MGARGAGGGGVAVLGAPVVGDDAGDVAGEFAASDNDDDDDDDTDDCDDAQGVGDVPALPPRSHLLGGAAVTSSSLDSAADGADVDSDDSDPEDAGQPDSPDADQHDNVDADEPSDKTTALPCPPPSRRVLRSSTRAGRLPPSGRCSGRPGSIPSSDPDSGRPPK